MSATISFNSYPLSQRTHGVFAEIDPQESGGSQNQRTLILGQMLATGSATDGMPVLGAGGSADGARLFGAGSQIALEYDWYLKRDVSGEVWLLPQADPAGGQAATGTVTFGGTATAAGTISLYVAGVLEAVSVASGATGAIVAAAWAAAVSADASSPATASVSGSVVTLTAKNKGVVGNEIDVRLNYRGAAGGEVLPAGLTVAIATPQLANGAGSPSSDVATGLSALGDKAFDFIVCPYTDGATLDQLKAYLNDSTGRWSWEQMLYGGVFTAVRGTAAALTTFGNGRNEYTAQALGFYDSPTPAWLWAANYAGACAVSLRADPGVPLQELQLDVLAPPLGSRFGISVRNTLLFDGISTFVVDDAGTVTIDRSVTFYQTDASGAPDTTWLNTETPYSVMFLTRDMVNFLKTTYGRKKIVADGTNIPGGSNWVTAQTVLASAWGRYRYYCDNGWAQNYAGFKAASRGEYAGNGRMNLLLPFILDDQLRQIVMKIAFLANT